MEHYRVGSGIPYGHYTMPHALASESEALRPQSVPPGAEASSWVPSAMNMPGELGSLPHSQVTSQVWPTPGLQPSSEPTTRPEYLWPQGVPIGTDASSWVPSAMGVSGVQRSPPHSQLTSAVWPTPGLRPRHEAASPAVPNRPLMWESPGRPTTGMLDPWSSPKAMVRPSSSRPLDLPVPPALTGPFPASLVRTPSVPVSSQVQYAQSLLLPVATPLTSEPLTFGLQRSRHPSPPQRPVPSSSRELPQRPDTLAEGLDYLHNLQRSYQGHPSPTLEATPHRSSSSSDESLRRAMAHLVEGQRIIAAAVCPRSSGPPSTSRSVGFSPSSARPITTQMPMSTDLVTSSIPHVPMTVSSSRLDAQAPIPSVWPSSNLGAFPGPPVPAAHVIPPHHLRPQVPPPAPLVHTATLRMYKQWRDQWRDYAAVIGLHLYALKTQLAMLRSSMTPQMREVLEHQVGISSEAVIPLDDVFTRLLHHFRAHMNNALRRWRFSTCTQETGESFGDFHVRLQQLAADVDLCAAGALQCRQDQIKHQIILGVREEFLRRHLLALPPHTTLQEVVTASRAREVALTSAPEDQVLAPGPRQTSSYKKGKRPSPPVPAAPPPSTPPAPVSTPASSSTSSAQPSSQPRSCMFCATTHPFRRALCPARDHVCTTCQGVGHYESVCSTLAAHTRKGRTTAATSTMPTADSPPPYREMDDQVTRAVVASVGVTSFPAPTVSVRVSCRTGDTRIKMIPDTGSDVTLMDASVLPLLGLRRQDLSRSPGPLYNPDGSSLTRRILGIRKIWLTYHDCQVLVPVYFLSGVSMNLISWIDCQSLGIIPASFPAPIQGEGRPAHWVQAVKTPDLTTPLVRPASCKSSVQRGLATPSSQPALSPQSSVVSPFSKPTSTCDLPIGVSPAAARAWFLREFKDVLISKTQFLDGAALNPLTGPPMRIFLRPDAEPFAISSPRPIPLAWLDDVRRELDALVAHGIIVPVGDSPSEWCHPLVIVPKPKGGVRLTVDLTKLNKQVSRPTHPSPTPYQAIRRVPAGTKFFTTMDALCGYWQLPLAPSDQHLTTFLTPLGRYRFCRGPMGFSATGDEFCRRGDLALVGIQQCTKVVDDILLWDTSFDTHIARVAQVLECCRRHGLTINSEKFVVAASEAAFCGYRLSSQGVAADPAKVQAIAEFPRPKNITDVRSFVGLTNQLAEFTHAISTVADPLRPLLRPSNQFMWTPDHEKAFNDVKAALSRTPVLTFFDPTRPTVLQTDASRLNGVGYALLQQDHGGVWRLVQCGSRFLADVESRYSTIELELVAVVWAMTKCAYYLLGLADFHLLTDHRPLIPILNTYTLDRINSPRLQRLREKIAGYTFTASWRKGSELCIPDALSRSPVSRPSPDDLLIADDVAASVRGVARYSSAHLVPDQASPQPDIFLDHLRQAALQDQLYARLLQCVHSGFPPSKSTLDADLAPFWKMRDDLTSDGGLILYGRRIFVPTACRKDVLARLHEAHRGIEATRRRARFTVWWPGVESDITSTVQACVPCQALLPSLPKEPLQPTPPSSRPFEAASADFGQVAGKHWLIYVDRFSGWPEAVYCGQDTTASKTVTAFTGLFATFGAPVMLRTDGGPQFSSKEFGDFLLRWGVRHEVSSPHFPQSNGHAEAGVKAVKYLLLKVAPSGSPSEAFSRSLLELRNTPSKDGLSPAQLLLGRSLRAYVPVHGSALDPTPPAQLSDALQARQARKDRERKAYDAQAHPLPRLLKGTKVLLQHPTTRRWDTRATVVSDCASLRRYEVFCPATGARYWRNRVFLRLDLSAVPPASTTSSPGAPPVPVSPAPPASEIPAVPLPVSPPSTDTAPPASPRVADPPGDTPVPSPGTSASPGRRRSRRPRKPKVCKCPHCYTAV